jgi:hypothetical protein
MGYTTCGYRVQPLQYALVAHTFLSFQRLLDKALAIEHKRVQLGDLKRTRHGDFLTKVQLRRAYIPVVVSKG